MAMTISCSGCGKKMRADEKSIGKKVKCPGCGNVQVVEQVAERHAFLVAALSGNLAEMKRHLADCTFHMIEDPQIVFEKDGAAGLMVEVDGSPALLAFTTTQHAKNFLKVAMPSSWEEVTLFSVEGKNFIEFLPEGIGVLINPETEGDGAILTMEQVNTLK